MSAISEKLAKQQKFAQRDLTICFDGSLSHKRDMAMAEVMLAQRATDPENPAPNARLGVNPVEEAKATVAAIEDEMRENSITLRFTAVNFGKYNSFITRNPPRKGNVVDQSYGFNASEFFLYVARQTAVQVDDNGHEQPIDEDDWKAIAEALTDGDHDRIAGVIIDLNRREGQRGVDFLQRKSEPTPESSETSESPETTE